MLQAPTPWAEEQVKEELQCHMHILHETGTPGYHCKSFCLVICLHGAHMSTVIAGKVACC